MINYAASLSQKVSLYQSINSVTLNPSYLGDQRMPISQNCSLHREIVFFNYTLKQLFQGLQVFSSLSSVLFCLHLS